MAFENGITIDGDLFKVLRNEEGQYSIWPAKKSNPAGWVEEGFSGAKEECSRFVDDHWTDLRPISLRKTMALSK